VTATPTPDRVPAAAPADPGHGEELVVLVDAQGRAAGTAPKRTVHHAQTPRHLAFSAYLFREDGSFLHTRRAVDKATFPGVWTNSACGHPGPGERLDEAVVRRVRQELGLDVRDLRLVLPRFAYRAEMDGVVEDELCPVYVGVVDGDVEAEPTEVEEYLWVDWADFAAQVRAGRREVSVWCREQVEALAALGAGPADWPTADDAQLPEAAPRA
jgi:isopentenyl-diphosphate delta-isomerase